MKKRSPERFQGKNFKRAQGKKRKGKRKKKKG
jgi:hypothetical protein